MYGVTQTLQGKRPLPSRIRKTKVRRFRRCCGTLVTALRVFCLRLRAAVLVLVASLGLPVFYLTLHLLLRPGLATLAAGFQPTLCIVTASSFVQGRANCNWSSCRQGCTSQELHLCWHVLILPLNARQDYMFFNHTFSHNISEMLDKSTHSLEKLTEITTNKTKMVKEVLYEALDDSPAAAHIHDYHPTIGIDLVDEIQVTNASLSPGDKREPGEAIVRLQVNVAGCGYGSCEAWWRQYGRRGSTFTCYLSADASLAVPDIDYTLVAVQVVLGAMPLLLTVFASITIYVCYCREDSTDRTLRLSPNHQQLKVKSEQARAQIVLQKSMEREGALPTFDCSVVLSVVNNTTPSQVTGESQQARSRKPSVPTSLGEKKRQLKAARRCRRVADLTAQHPEISSAPIFTEITLYPKSNI
ncbi:protein tipE-like [Procambarus clarkii]|uniref:protein tipE-like n=1 Tax=Procambarus clarkii TaxID=6728 RepID=UPI003742DE8E